MINEPSAVVNALLAAGCSSGEGDKPEVKLDYAYYNPSSLVIRDQGWLESRDE